jgi:spermidine synthase
VVLVDYDLAVVELGRTMFAPFNHDSLQVGSRVQVQIQDALEFVAHQPDASFHVVLCDFTFPTTPESTRVYSREWFEQVNRVLHPGGMLCANAISPERHGAAFWCLYQTLRAAGLSAYPLTCEIPSFREHSYGLWGFLLASSDGICRSALSALQFPADLPVVNVSLALPQSMTQLRNRVYIHTLDHPHLLYYLLNEPSRNVSGSQSENQQAENQQAVDQQAVDDPLIDFLDLPDQDCNPVSPRDPLQLESLVQAWLQDAQRLQSQPAQLCPVQHPGITPTMAQSWLEHVPSLLNQIDRPALLAQLQARGVQIGMAADGAVQNRELTVVLAAVLVAANLAVPDAVFAKGYSGGGHYSGSSWHSGGSYRSGSSGSNSCSQKEYYPDGSYDCIKSDAFPWMGLIFTLGGGAWLWALLRRPPEEMN